MSDTSPEAAAIQAEIHRRMTGTQRLDLAIEMSMFARDLALTRLRREHPDWSEWEELAQGLGFLPLTSELADERRERHRRAKAPDRPIGGDLRET